MPRDLGFLVMLSTQLPIALQLWVRMHYAPENQVLGIPSYTAT